MGCHRPDLGTVPEPGTGAFQNGTGRVDTRSADEYYYWSQPDNALALKIAFALALVFAPYPHPQ